MLKLERICDLCSVGLCLGVSSWLPGGVDVPEYPGVVEAGQGRGRPGQLGEGCGREKEGRGSHHNLQY